MNLKYKSCIFCDEIFEHSQIHECKIDNIIDEVNDGNEIMNENEEQSVLPVVDHDHYKTNIVGVSVITTGDNLYNELYCTVCGSKTTLQNQFDKDSESVPSQLELYKMVIQLTDKCDKLQKEVYKLNIKTNNRLKRDIHQYLQSDLRMRTTFLEWMKSFRVTEDMLKSVFNGNIVDGVIHCLKENIDEMGVYGIPVRIFKEKPEWIFVYTNEPIKKVKNKDVMKEDTNSKYEPVEIELGVSDDKLLKESIWRMVPKSDFSRIKNYILRQFEIAFDNWETEYRVKHILTSERKELIYAYFMKATENYPNTVKNRHTSEIYKWFCEKIIQ